MASVTVTKDNVRKVVEAVERLTKRQVLIGIPQTTSERSDGGVTNAQIGYWNEFGAPGRNLPPRPHLVPGVEAVATQAGERLRDAGRLALDGKPSGDIENQFHAVGVMAVSSVQNKIAAVIPPPLSPKTLQKRRAKGHAGETPLIETGEYRQHLTYVVRDKK